MRKSFNSAQTRYDEESGECLVVAVCELCAVAVYNNRCDHNDPGGHGGFQLLKQSLLTRFNIDFVNPAGIFGGSVAKQGSAIAGPLYGVKFRIDLGKCTRSATIEGIDD